MMNQGGTERTGHVAGQDDAERGTMTELGLGGIDPKQVVGVVSEFARENPHAALAGALALGFLLGGGLTPRLLSGIVMLAGRKYMNQSVRGIVSNVIREQIGGQTEA